MQRMIGLQPDASIIIPAYNEGEELELLLQEISRDLEGKISTQIIVVDDGSSDGTGIIAKELGANVIWLRQNHGYGFALRTGLKHATGSVVVFLDADGQCDPAEIPKLVDFVLKGKADVIFASRYLKPQRKTSFFERFMNLYTSLLIRLVLGVRVTDFGTGLKVFRRSITSDFDLKENGVAINLELLAEAAKKQWKIVEVPTTYRMRFSTRAKKLFPWFRIFLWLLREGP
jgi:glycosyltransferase involved in cell wall biosynthesis